MNFRNRIRRIFGKRPRAPRAAPGVFGFYAIYGASFLFTFHFAIPNYLNSSFIEGVAGKDLVGILFALGALIGLGLLVKMPPILRAFGNRRTVIFLMGLEFLALVTLATFSNVFVVTSAFVLSQALIPVIIFNLDLFLESYSRDDETGGIRGIALTLINMAVLAGPLVAAFVFVDSEFWKIFLLSALAIIPVIFLVFFSLKTFKDPYYVDISYKDAFQNLKAEPNVRNTLLLQFLLKFFYIWYAIYIPIYLTTEIGFSFSEILGIMVPVTMIPFMLLQYPLGKIADKDHVEREWLIFGFVVFALATGFLSFIDSTSIIFWTSALFLVRVGAAIVEVMIVSVFYKQIEAKHVNLISMFRTLRPAASIVAPLVATLLLVAFSFSYQYLFLALGIILLAGIPLSYAIRYKKDTIL